MYFIHTGDWLLASRPLHPRQHRRQRQLRLLRRPAAAHRLDDEIDRVSTAGYALGYLGGGLLLALNLAWIQKPAWFGLPSGADLTEAQATLPARLAFVSVAVWWFVFSIPLFRRVPEPKAVVKPEELAGGQSRPRHVARLGGDRPRAAAVQAGVPDAAGVPDLQRRHRHDHPDGDDLRRGDRRSIRGR